MAAVSGFSTPCAGGPPLASYGQQAYGSFVPPAPVGTGAGAAVYMSQQHPPYMRGAPGSYAPTPTMVAGHPGMAPTLPPDQAAQLMSARTGAGVPGSGQWVLPPTMPQCAGAVGGPGTAAMGAGAGPQRNSRNPLTEGIPDPASIESQKKNYEKTLDASLEQSQKMAAEQIKQQKEALKVAAQQQLEMYKAQMDQTVKQHELGLDQQLQHQQMEMQQALLQQKTILEQQASALSMEYKQRKMQEEMMLKQAEMHAEMQTLHGRMQEEMAQHQQQHMKMQQQHVMQQQAQQQHMVSQQQTQEMQLRDQMQREMLAQQQQLAQGGVHPGAQQQYAGMPPGVMHMGIPGTVQGSINYGAHGAQSMPMEYPIGMGSMGVHGASMGTMGSVGSMGLRPVEGPSVAPLVTQGPTRVIDHRMGGAATPAAPGGSATATPVGTSAGSAVYGGRPSMYGGQSLPPGAVYLQPVTSLGAASMAGAGTMMGGGSLAAAGPGGAPFEPSGAQPNDGSLAGC